MQITSFKQADTLLSTASGYVIMLIYVKRRALNKRCVKAKTEFT